MRVALYTCCSLQSLYPNTSMIFVGEQERWAQAGQAVVRFNVRGRKESVVLQQ
jgi:predicted acyl esterase